MDSLTLLYDCKTKVLQRFFIAKNNKRKHRFLHVPLSFFENQQKKQKQELLRLADKYKSRAYAEAKINQGKTVAYFDGFFEIYMPFPDIDVWKRILADTTA